MTSTANIVSIASIRARTRAHGLALIGLLLLGSCAPGVPGEGSLGSGGGPQGAPGAPTITATTSAINSITVSWTAVSGAASYNVYDALTGVPSSSNTIDDNSTPATTLTFSPSSLGVPLVVTVSATDSNGDEGNVSASHTISTLVPTVTVVDQVSGTSNLLVSWTAVTGAASYNIYVTKSATDGGAAPTENGSGHNVLAPATTDAWDAVTTGDYYTFAVSAVDQANNEGGLSAPIAIVAPAQP